MREGDTVNVFDRAVAAVAPVHAAKRAAARAALKIIDSGYGNYGASITQGRHTPCCCDADRR